MDKIRLSIVIPVYDAEDYLSRCLESILDQGFTSYEVILVNDGSTDSSPLICDRYSSTDSRFRTIHKSNGGVSSARNAGLNLAKGEYVMFVDADDALLPDALEMMMEGASGEDLIIGGYAMFIGGVPRKEILPKETRSYRGGEMRRFFDDNVRRHCDILDSPWSKMFRRKALGDLRFCEGLSYAEDKLFLYDFLSRCSSVHTCNTPIYAFHIRPGSLGSDISSDLHLMQLRRFIPEYMKALDVLNEKYHLDQKFRFIYHKDVVGTYACRILSIFRKRKTAILDKDYIAWIYSLIDSDLSAGIFSFGAGRVLDMLLYKVGKPGLSVRVYRILSSFH